MKVISSAVACRVSFQKRSVRDMLKTQTCSMKDCADSRSSREESKRELPSTAAIREVSRSRAQVRWDRNRRRYKARLYTRARALAPSMAQTNFMANFLVCGGDFHPAQRL